MQAIVFDIDGTLVDSNDADGELFVEAVKRILGLGDIRSDWTTYRHVTDQGVLSEIMQDHGIPLQPELFEATKREFISLLDAHLENNGPFREIPGAVSYVSRLNASQAHYVAYATGGWHESALLKLESAGFPVDGLRIATSSEFEDRESIMRAALSGPAESFESVTYYGDGVWDRSAAENLGWQFVPVGGALDGLRDYHQV